MFDVDKLNEFYEEISSDEGISIGSFQDSLKSLFQDQRSSSDIENFRLGKSPWKKLRDEITPVSRFIEFNDIGADRIRFPLDNHTPDCWLLFDVSENLGVEVTIERGREKYHLAKELNETGRGRGFIGIQDDSSQTKFDERLSKPRTMFSSEQALEATKAGIIRCLSRKNETKYKNIHYLLIQVHLNNLPKERWSLIKDDLRQVAKKLLFQEIHVIGDAGDESWGFQIK